jgi:hypothetical protein
VAKILRLCLLPWLAFLRLQLKKTSREEQFHNGCRGHSLPDPKKEHPFDNLGFEAVHFRADFRLEFYSILFGHEPLGEVILLIAERNLQALGDRPRLGRFDARSLQNSEYLCRAHQRVKFPCSQAKSSDKGGKTTEKGSFRFFEHKITKGTKERPATAGRRRKFEG